MARTADSKKANGIVDRNKRNQGMNWIWRPTREAIYHRDGDTCLYCRRRAVDGARLTLDHVVPHALGGADKPENLVTACFECNSLRQDLPVTEFAQTLYDRGIDAEAVGQRVTRALATPIDRAEGRRRAKAAGFRGART